MLISGRRASGFSAIELMIVLAIAGILLAVGAPAFREYTMNSRILAAAQGLFGAMQQARGEAIRSNGRVQVLLTDNTALNNPNITDTLATGKSWMVRSYNATTATYALVNARSSSEGAGSNTLAVNGSVAMVEFTPLGGTTLTSAATFAFSADGQTCGTGVSGGIRCINVIVTPGGRSQICDPAVTTAGDARACVTS